LFENSGDQISSITVAAFSFSAVLMRPRRRDRWFRFPFFPGCAASRRFSSAFSEYDSCSRCVGFLFRSYSATR
ncbi:MAG: hypothetical protein ACKOEO_23045, partial [Planctomycetaceae bacterium]